jgi:putative peptide zinc metalloprotease protein
MVTLHDSLVSSSARAISIRKRPDLVARRQHYLGRTYWVVKDPVGLQYFRFQEEEFAILQMLDGTISMDEIKERFEDEFPPQKITLDELQQFLGMLHRSGLVVADVTGQGRQLRLRRDKRKRQEWLQTLGNILCIRFKGFDPERVLNFLYPYFRWFFSVPALAFCLLLALSALMLVLAEFDVFRSKLPEFKDFFNIHNAFLLALTLGVTKVFHEFGHGLACKHFGGECHEIGIMILVLTPCLYCNVSDSWMLPNKWHRAIIGAAGIYVELMIASICTFLWWFSVPGLLNSLCLNAMFICSVSTVLFNGNPLLRYDGYYILSDLTEIPNLRQKATTILSRKLGEWCLGMEMSEDPFLPESNQIFFALFSIAAAVYRWIIAFSICWFLYRLFDSYHLKFVGQLVVAASLWALFFTPLYQLGKFFYVPGRLDKVKKTHMYVTLSVLAAVVLVVLFLPLPHSVLATFEIQARDAESVYVGVPGKLIAIEVKPGRQVEKGTPLGQLRNIELEEEIAKLTMQERQYSVKLESLRRQGFDDPHAQSEIPATLESLYAAKEQLQKKEADFERLCLKAPISGTVLPPQLVPRREDPDGQLPAWSGSPLEKENLGAFLQEGVLFCQIGDPRKLEAVVVIDQADRNLVRKDQRVYIKIDELPHDTFTSKVAEIAESELKISPPRLSNKSGGELPTKTDPHSGVERPVSTSYQARVPLDDETGLMRLGLRGTARIQTDWIPLGTRFWRFVTHTFNFKL